MRATNLGFICRGRRLTVVIFALALWWPVCAPAQSPLIIGTSYKVLLSTPAQDGMLDRIAQEAFRRLGLTIELPYLATERSIRMANEGYHDGELNRVAGMEKLYPNLVRVDEPMMVFEFVAFTKKTALTGGDWAVLRPHQIGIIKGWKILEAKVGHYPRLTYYHSADDLFRGLAADRVDVILYGRRIGLAVKERLGLAHIRAVAPPFAVRPMYLYLHKKHRHRAVALAAALKEMKGDGTYADIEAQAMAPLGFVETP